MTCLNDYESPIYTNNMVYILNLKDPASFIIQWILSLHLGLNRGHSDPETDDIPLCLPSPTKIYGKRIQLKQSSEMKTCVHPPFVNLTTSTTIWLGTYTPAKSTKGQQLISSAGGNLEQWQISKNEIEWYSIIEIVVSCLLMAAWKIYLLCGKLRVF